MGLHFLFLFGLRRHERGYLLFGLPTGYAGELHQKLLFITLLMLQVVAVQLAAVLFPQEASPKATKVITLMALLGMGFTLAMPASLSSKLLFARIATDLIVPMYAPGKQGPRLHRRGLLSERGDSRGTP